MVRLQRRHMSEEAWVQHVKLRKKKASARWYVKKQTTLKKKWKVVLEDLEQKKQAEERRKWEQRRLEYAYFRCALHHHVRGYPVRPEEANPLEWCGLIDGIETDLGAANHNIDDLNPTIQNWYWLYIRNMCIRERLRDTKWMMHRVDYGGVFVRLVLDGRLKDWAPYRRNYVYIPDPPPQPAETFYDGSVRAIFSSRLLTSGVVEAAEIDKERAQVPEMALAVP